MKVKFATCFGLIGPSALTLDGLTTAARKTRGSFYHHFADRDVFLMELVEDWSRRVLRDRAFALPPLDQPSELRAFLCAEPFSWDHRFERNLRQLAVIEPVVGRGVAAVDDARVEGLAVVIAALRPDVADPRSEAFIQYAVAVGAQWLINDQDEPRLARIRTAALLRFGLVEPTARER